MRSVRMATCTSGEPVSPSVPEGIGPRPLPLAEEEIFALAEDASPTVEAAALAVESADAGIKSSRTSYIPSLGMSGGYGWNNGEWALADGLTYRVPVGFDSYFFDQTNFAPFKYLRLNLVAFANDNEVLVDNGMGGTSVSFTLDKGQHWDSV